MKYCLNCKQNVEPDKNGGAYAIIGIVLIIMLTVVLSVFSTAAAAFGWMLGLLIVGIGYELDKGKCPICKANNFSPTKKKK